jgi:hypothetical protein
MRVRFPLGAIVRTPGFAALEIDPMPFLRRHMTGDWGEVSPEDAAENNLSVIRGFRILSAYRAPDGTRFWIITEADRLVTTLLLPSEY